MLRSIRELNGYDIEATDGIIGKADEFLFDDQSWIIRYLVVNTGTWLFGRKVIIPPAGLRPPDWKRRAFPVHLTMDQVKHSPEIDWNKPVSREQEQEIHDSYGWLPYWETGAMGSFLPPPVTLAATEDKSQKKEQHAEPSLRSTKDVIGYHISAVDGEIGHVDDFISDDEEWVIRYAVIDTRNWIPGTKVMLAREWITDISWKDKKVFVGMTQDAIRNSPRFDPNVPVNREYEVRLYDYYGRPKYWS